MLYGDYPRHSFPKLCDNKGVLPPPLPALPGSFADTHAKKSIQLFTALIEGPLVTSRLKVLIYH